jgi:sulfate adenylyltransferase
MPDKNQDAIAPHGGTLVNVDAPAAERESLVAKAKSLTPIPLGPREISDLELIAIGGFSPLRGFMTSADYSRVVSDMSLASGLPWSIPVTLSVKDDLAKKLKAGKEAALVDGAGTVLALMTVEEVFPNDK